MNGFPPSWGAESGAFRAMGRSLDGGASRGVLEGSPSAIRRSDVKWLTPEAFRLWRNVGLRGFTFDGMPAESWSGRTEDRDVAFAAGMSRLSCRFCVLSSRADLVCSARLNPDLADRYAEVERRIGHRFRTDLTMADVIAEAHDAGQLALIPLAAIA